MDSLKAKESMFFVPDTKRPDDTPDPLYDLERVTDLTINVHPLIHTLRPVGGRALLFFVSVYF